MTNFNSHSIVFSAYVATSLLACSDSVTPRDGDTRWGDAAVDVTEGDRSSTLLDADTSVIQDVGPQSLNLQVMHTRPLAPIECRACRYRMTNPAGAVHEGSLDERGRLDVVVPFDSPWDITIAIPTVGAISILGVDAPFDRPVFFVNKPFWWFPPTGTALTQHAVRFAGPLVPNQFVVFSGVDTEQFGFQAPDRLATTVGIDARANLLQNVISPGRYERSPDLEWFWTFYTTTVAQLGSTSWELRRDLQLSDVRTDAPWPIAPSGIFARTALSGVVPRLGNGVLYRRSGSALNPALTTRMGGCLLEGDPLRPSMHCQRSPDFGEADRAEYVAFPDGIVGEIYVTHRNPFSTPWPVLPIVQGSVWSPGEQLRFGAQFEGDLYAGFHFTHPGSRTNRNEFNWMGYAFRPGFREELRVMPRLPTGVRYADIGYNNPGHVGEILVTMTQGTPGVPPWDARFRLDHETIRAYGRAFHVSNIDQ